MEQLEIPTRCKLGDVWQLGRHFLYCCDSETKDHVDDTVNNHGVATLVFTDPPYQMSTLHGSKNSMLPIETRPGHQSIKEEELGNFDPSKFLNLLPSYFKPGTIAAYIFHSKDSTPDYYGWVRDQKQCAIRYPYPFEEYKSPTGLLKGICVTPLVWYKTSDTTGKSNPIPFGKAHHNDVEYLMYIRLNGKWNNVDKAPLCHRGRVLEHPKQKGIHPTTKPVPLIVNQLLLTTDPNDLVYDPYGGSGSTLIACEQTGRRCILTEKLPKFCDLTISRFEGEIGKLAERIN